MKIYKFILYNRNKILNSISDINKKPLESILRIIPVLMMTISTFIMLVEVILFIIGEIFLKQSNNMRIELFTSGIINKIILILLIIEIIGISILLYKNKYKGKLYKIKVLIYLFGGILGYITNILFIGKSIIIKISYEMQCKIIDTVLNKININILLNIIRVNIFIGIISLILLIAMIIKSQYKFILKDIILAIIISLVLNPIILILVKNIFSIISFIFKLLIVGIVLYLINKISDCSNDENMEYNNIETSINNKNKINNNNSKNYKEDKKEYEARKVIKDFKGPFFRDKGGLGILQGQEDYIYCYNIYKEKMALCPVSDFESGDVIIKDARNGLRVTEVAGCNRPWR